MIFSPRMTAITGSSFAQLGQRLPDLRRRDLALDDVQPLTHREEVLEDGDDLGAVHRLPQ
jgi:hypothetical protein